MDEFLEGSLGGWNAAGSLGLEPKAASTTAASGKRRSRDDGMGLGQVAGATFRYRLQIEHSSAPRTVRFRMRGGGAYWLPGRGLGMADSKAFEIACGELERATALSGLEARGTIRIALKKSGLDAAAVTAREMDVILHRVLPKELTLRGVDDADGVASGIAAALISADLADESRSDSPEAVFSRLGG